MSGWLPDTLWWVLTARCNLKCQHCYLAPNDKIRPELSTEEALDVLRGAAASGISRLVITGGEPFLRPDLARLLVAAAELGIHLDRIETNGTCLRPDAVEVALKHGTEFAVSLDGIQSHDHLRSAEGLHDRTVRAIEGLARRGARVVVQTVLTPVTLRDLPDLQREITRLRPHGWRLFAPVALGAWAERDEVGPAEELRAYEGVLEQWLRAGRPFELWLGSLLTQRRDRDVPEQPRAYVCNHASAVVTLMPDGRVHACCRLAELAPEDEKALQVLDAGWATCFEGLRPLKQHPFETLLNHDANEDCRSCSLLPVCELGCRAQALLEGRGQRGSSRRQCWLMRHGYRGEMRRWDVRGNARRRA